MVGCPELVESVIQDAIRAEYLHRQKPNLAALHRKVLRKCKAEGLRAPARSTGSQQDRQAAQRRLRKPG